ncbi:hypothetical protein Ccar_16255 [Clostridium carboxidivorans P7]|uniref:HTH cro/C1-type domain-containing protein n=1 Tax=Clostridium carboxidivorans P7 TaxID=536227 RepID=C6PT15_9CLOT|nr:helix-turn-helix transcriptional regulator [Clostridium carboxidivorans]AKN32330.1 hypothetical protein Ccar_16255 [Clostridium carboxidivorans P7]EET87650.1 hypothetical protein CcarbDRAFT_1932 [Clostridium carboxidivorans P7]
MIICKLEEYLDKVKKTKYWLSKNTGISQNSIGKLVANKTTSINFDVLSKIIETCEKVDPNVKITDIIDYIEDENINKNEKVEE